MANDIDEAYLARLTAFEFPDMPVEPAAAPTAGAGRGSYAGYDPAQDAAAKAPQASMTEYDPTIKEQLATLLQRGFEGMGVDRYQARKNAQTLMGGESSNAPLSLGLADFVPLLGTALQTQEAYRMGEEAVQSVQQGDYGTAALQGAGAMLGLVPGAAGTIKAGKQLLSETGQQLDRAIMEGTGPLAAVVPDALKPMYAVQPGKGMPPVLDLQPGVDVVSGNKIGVEADLRVKVPQADLEMPDKPLLVLSTDAKNVNRQIENLDVVFAKFPEPVLNQDSWTRMMSYAFKSDEVPVPPYAAIKALESPDNLAAPLRKLSQRRCQIIW